jgi:lysophospholipase L1-like esterase
MITEKRIPIKGIIRMAGLIKTAWLVAGIVLILLIALELASSLLLTIKHALVPIQDQRVHADAYGSADWIDAYFDELKMASITRWRPYVYWRRKPFSGRYINIDQNGLRRTSYQETEADRLDIFIFGGSSIWGNGVRDEYTIPSLLGKKLLEQGIRNKVTNFGEDGYVSTQEIIELVLQLQRGNTPDLVIFYDGVNDTFSGLQNGFAGLPQNEWNREQAFTLSKTSESNVFREYFFLRVLRDTSTIRIVEALIDRLFPSPQQSFKKFPSWGRDSDNIESDILDTYFSNINIVNALGQAYGFKALFFWQPIVYTKGRQTEYEKEQIKYVGKEMEDFFVETYALVKHKEAMFQGNFINLSDIFAEVETPLYIDIFHVSEEANELITSRMMEDLTKLIMR